MGAPIRIAGSLLAALLLANCGEGGRGTANSDSQDGPLECAAVISTYTYMGQEGAIELDEALHSKSLVSLMTYLNSYAIPKGLSEPEAFAELNALRDKMLADVPPDDIAKRARHCIENTPET